MIAFILVLVLGIIVFIIVMNHQDSKQKDFVKSLKEECEKKRTQFLDDLRSDFGEISKMLQCPFTPVEYNLQKDDGYYVIQLHHAKKLIIDHVMYDYSDISEYELHEEIVTDPSDNISTSVTKTNMNSLIGRAVVGAVVAGGVGALIGGTTASKTTKTIETKSIGVGMLYLKVVAKKQDKYIKNFQYQGYMSCSIHRDVWNKYICDIENVLHQVIEDNTKEIQCNKY